MKGTLNKHEEGWLVRYGDMQFLPLHPDFIEMMDTCFTSKFTQVVDFEMVLCSHSKSKDDYYAKLINHSVESNEMIENDVEKLAETEYPIFDGDLLGISYNQKQSRIDFIKGYNKAIESQLPKQEISDGAKDTADYIDRHIIESMKELAKEGFKPKLSEISDEEIYKASREHITDGGGAQGWIESAFRQGAVWYREQLRLKLKGGKDE